MINQIAYNSLQKVSSTLKSIYNIRMHRIHKFKPKIELSVEIGSFLLKTVSTAKELKQALELRNQIFYKEKYGVKNYQGLNIDEFDYFCDHLVIYDRRNSKIVGTYRLNCSQFNDEFSSASKFSMDRIIEHEGIKVELGQAYIHQDYRRGLVFSLFWKGIAEYMNACSGQIIFGSVSVKTVSPRNAALLYKLFYERNRFLPEYFCPPLLNHSLSQLDLWIQNFKTPLSPNEKSEAMDMISPIFKTHLKMGAYIGGAPAWDNDFRCIEFLTILNKEDLNRSLWKRSNQDSELLSELFIF